MSAFADMPSWLQNEIIVLVITAVALGLALVARAARDRETPATSAAGRRDTVTTSLHGDPSSQPAVGRVRAVIMACTLRR
jgi:hypothetical protein